jgi:cell division protein FtsB
MKAPIVRFTLILIVLAVCGYAVFTFQGPGGMRALAEREARIKELEERNAALAKEVERKRERTRRLNESPAEQELEIRDRLRLVHPNEKVYVIGQPEKERKEPEAAPPRSKEGNSQ